MQSLLVVDPMHKLFDSLLRFLKTAILAAVQLFVLQRFHEALRVSIIVRVAAPAHADRDLMLAQALRVGLRGILNPAIGMMHPSSPHPTHA